RRGVLRDESHGFASGAGTRAAMKFRNETAQSRDQPARLGVLVANLGTTATPAVRDVRRYLAELLADPRVVELPRAAWRLALHGVVLRVRPARSARAYARVWQPEGSPLLVNGQQLVASLQQRLSAALNGPAHV